MRSWPELLADYFVAVCRRHFGLPSQVSSLKTWARASSSASIFPIIALWAWSCRVICSCRVSMKIWASASSWVYLSNYCVMAWSCRVICPPKILTAVRIAYWWAVESGFTVICSWLFRSCLSLPFRLAEPGLVFEDLGQDVQLGVYLSNYCVMGLELPRY